MPREAADVHLVDHGFGERPVQRGVPFPVVAPGSATTLFIARRAVVARPAGAPMRL